MPSEPQYLLHKHFPLLQSRSLSNSGEVQTHRTDPLVTELMRGRRRATIISVTGAMEKACLKCSKNTEEAVINLSGLEKGEDEEGKA